MVELVPFASPWLAFGRRVTGTQAAGIVGFGAAVLAGDRNQFLREPRQIDVIPILGVASRRYVCPLDSNNASDWVEALAKQSVRVASISSSTQYRCWGYH